MQQQTVGFVGLGLMGTAMTTNLIEAGYDVLGYDPDPDRLGEHRDRGGRTTDGAGAVAADASVIVLSLPNSGIGTQVCLGPDGIRAHAAAGALVIDTTTGRPDDAVAIGAGLADAGIRYVDATISGNAAQTSRRDIVVMVGGDPDAYRDALPVFGAIARSSHHLGPVGAGARTKLIVNLVLGVHRFVLAEALVLGEKSGLELDRLLEVLRDGAAYSRAMDIWGPRMVAGDHFPPASRIRQNHKDFRLIVEQAQTAGSPLFFGSTVEQLLGVAEATGLSDADNSGVVALLRSLAGLPTRIEGD